MLRQLCSAIMFYGTLAATMLVLSSKPLHALPSTILSNDVYPDNMLSSNDPQFPLAFARNISTATELLEFLMKFEQDERICFSSDIRDLVFSVGKNDPSTINWWGSRCLGPPIPVSYRQQSSSQPESALIRARRKAATQLTEKDKKMLKKLLTNKKVQCNPKKSVVRLPNNDTNVMLKPPCVYIKQCGGCCDSPHLECRPKKINIKKFPVYALETGPIATQTIKKVAVEEHVQCLCECKVREEHCTKKQKYEPHTCRCACPKEINRTCAPGKVWNERECDCVCNDKSECTTGRFFDKNTCRICV